MRRIALVALVVAASGFALALRAAPTTSAVERAVA